MICLAVFIGIVALAIVAIRVYFAMTDLEERLRRLEVDHHELRRDLSCGGGILGCKGGPKCTSDHK